MSSRSARPLRASISITAGFCLFALCSSDPVLNSLGFLSSSWIVPVLMWAVAILVAVSEFSRSPQRWTSPAICAAYALASLCSTYFAFSGPGHQLWYWGFPTLMWMMAGVFALASFRASSRRTRSTFRPHQAGLPLSAPPSA